MKKLLILATFLLASSFYVFLRQPLSANATIGTPDALSVIGTSTSSVEQKSSIASMLQAQIAQVEAHIKTLENAATAMVALPQKAQASLAVSATTPVAPVTSATTVTTAAPAFVNNNGRYNDAYGALMNANGTPVRAPAGSRKSANGLWYSPSGQGYALGPIGAAAVIAPAPVVVAAPVVSTAPVVVPVAPAPTPPAPTTATHHHSEQHDD